MSAADTIRSKSLNPRVPVNVGVTPELKRRLSECAARRQVFEATLVREALEQYLAAAEGETP